MDVLSSERHLKSMIKRWGITSCLIACMSFSTSAELPAFNILYLNSYHTGFQWSDAIEQGFMDTVTSNGKTLEVYFERMDSKRFPMSTVHDSVRQSIFDKYQDITFDAIVTSDDNAFNFALDIRRDFFPDTTIIFSGVNDVNNPALATKEKLSGVMENVNYSGLIELIQQVHPDLAHIAILGDSTASADIHIDITSDILNRQFPDIQYSVHKEWTLP